MMDKAKAKEMAGNVGLIVGVVVIVLLFTQFLYSFTLVSGASMHPTYHNGDLVIVKKLPHEVQRNDVVICKAPTGELLIKRVVGMPGEEVSAVEGVLHINGWGYADDPSKEFTEMEGSVEVGEGTYFVLGDNRTNSADSRKYGCIPQSNIKGLVVATVPRYLPIIAVVILATGIFILPAIKKKPDKEPLINEDEPV